MNKMNRLLEVLHACLLTLCVAGVLFGVLGEDGFGLKTEVCALLFLAACAWAGGAIVRAIGLPELLGMLSVGILFRSFLSFDKYVSVKWSSIIRDCALTLILLKAGLGLDPVKLSTLKFAVLRLALIPCLAEAVGITVISRLLLGLPWTWSLLLGFALCAVSAAVLVPGMIDLDEKRFGTEKGISTLLLAAVSVDNTVALAGFFISMSVLTTQEISASSVMTKAVEPFAGLLLGGVSGFLMWWTPRQNDTEASLPYERALFLCVGGLNFILLSKRLEGAGVGALGCVTCAFIASLRWRQQTAQFNTVVGIIGMLWKILELFLFSLIGVQVTLGRLKQNLGVGLAILSLGLFIRFTSTFAALCGTRMNRREKCFVSSAWISKATVQAAVGSVALEYFQGKNPETRFAQEVVSLCVLSIVLTAPLGALVIHHLGPRLLLHPLPGDEEEEEDRSARRSSEKVAQAAHEIARIMHHEGMVP